MPRKLLLVLFFVILTGVAMVVVWRRGQTGASPSAPALPPPALPVVIGPPSLPAPPQVAAPAPVVPPPPNSDPPLTVHQQMGLVAATLEDFRRSLGENPVGSNAEITRSLLGENAKKLQFPPPSGSRQNADGEMLDQWGTPYFFHQLSKTEMEIRSAGPDRKMWTDDDAVAK